MDSCEMIVVIVMPFGSNLFKRQLEHDVTKYDVTEHSITEYGFTEHSVTDHVFVVMFLW